MLGTTIIASALVTGDTMNRTVRSAVVESLGRDRRARRDARRRPRRTSTGSGHADVQYLRERTSPRSSVRCAARDWSTASRPAIMEPVAVQDLTSRQTEARVGLFAPDPAR